MRSSTRGILVLFAVVLGFNASAATLFVDAANPFPVLPFTNWLTAATDIQSAIDAASDGDGILVTNGVYATGGRVVYGSLTNRVVIDKAVTVQSVNGPAVTSIQGNSALSDDAVRCVYMTNSSVLAGFTLIGGATRTTGDKIAEQSGGGVWCESASGFISNCIVTANSSQWVAGGAYSGTLDNCQLINNTNKNGSLGGGGGAAFAVLLNSTLSGNWQPNAGAGAFSSTLSNCVIAGNSRGGVMNCVLDNCLVYQNTNGYAGGGARESLLNHCALYDNRAVYGGGAYQCELNYCIVSNNFATSQGGGVYELANATNRCGFGNQLTGNSANLDGGGIYFSPQSISFLVATNWIFTDWTFTSNSAVHFGGGFYLSRSTTLSNCTFTGNSAGSDGGGLYVPGPSSLNGCVFDGNFAGGNGGGLLGVIGSSYITTASNCIFNGNVAAKVGGGAYQGSLYNCLVIGNRAADAGGVYGMINDCMVQDNFATNNGGGIYFYYSAVNNGPTLTNNTFTNNMALNGGGAYGGIFSNCFFFANFAQSNGGGAFRSTLKSSVLVSNQASFGGGGYDGTYSRCNFTNNVAFNSGGGCCGGLAPGLATNCVFTGNHAAINGGGAFSTISHELHQCLFFGNSAGTNGGGSYGLFLFGCLFNGNSAVNGGGAYLTTVTANNSTLVGNNATGKGGGIFSSAGTITSCIVYDNFAPNGSNYFGGTSYFCCTAPLPPGGSNITNSPAFIDPTAGNFRLQTNSPCINLGSGSPGPVDLDGRPRVVGGRIDIGAYEFQGPGIGEFTGWLQQYGLPTNGSADYLDSDGDFLNNWQEWIAGTIPTNAASVLLLASPAPGISGIKVTWQSVSGVTYYLQRSTNLPDFSSIQSNLVGQAGSTTYTDTTATNGGPYFYRVGVQ